MTENISEHMARVRRGYCDIVPFVYRVVEARNPREAHELAMRFVVIDALEIANG